VPGFAPPPALAPSTALSPSPSAIPQQPPPADLLTVLQQHPWLSALMVSYPSVAPGLMAPGLGKFPSCRIFNAHSAPPLSGHFSFMGSTLLIAFSVRQAFQFSISSLYALCLKISIPSLRSLLCRRVS
jgi:hypothetical protein